MSAMAEPSHPVISIVLPAYGEEAGIGNALDVISGVLDGVGLPFEILVVDDGSRDATFERVRERARLDPRICGVRFSRNFGKEAAISAGLRAARGQAIITMDSDLQHPPDLLPRMIEAWQGGARVVHAVKESRTGDPWHVRLRARLFNGLMRRLGGVDLQEASDYKLLDRKVANIVAHRLTERKRFYRGLAAWVGYKSVDIPFVVADRPIGATRWTSLRLVELAVTALVSFTSAPLRIVTLLGVVTLALSGVLVIDTLHSWMLGRTVSGFSTLVITQLIIGSFIMISLGIIGEYIAKIYEEVKHRPDYLVGDAVNLETSPNHEVAEAARTAAEAAGQPAR